MRQGLRTTTSRRLAIVTALVSGAITVVATNAGPAAAAVSVVANYQMNEAPGARVMVDGSPFDLDGSIGTSIDVGPIGAVSGYHWEYVPPDAPPVDDQRLAVVPTSELLNPADAAFTVEIRFRTTRTAGNVVQKGQSSTDGGYWKLEQNSGRPTCLFRRNSTDQVQVMAPSPVNDGAWHTVRCERTASGLSMFVDGTRVDRNTRPVGSIVNSFPMTIGGKLGCNQLTVGCDYFTGDIDYVTISKDVPSVPNTAPTMAIDTPTCDELTCTFNSSASHDPDGRIVDRAWDFGDGSTVEHQDVVATHSFATPGTYTVSLVGTDDDGASSEPAEVTVRVDGPPNQPPDMSFTWSCDQAVCTFDSSQSIDPDGTIVERRWEFGDGTSTTLSSATVDHTYGVSRDYTVRLVGTDDDGGVTATSVTVAVTIPPEGEVSQASRLVPVTPARAFDTRRGEPGGGPKGVVRGGESIDVDVTGVAGVPSSGVTAVVVNIAAIGIGAPSYVAARPSGTPESNSSSLNVLTTGEVRSNLVIVPVGADGRITLTSLRDAHLVGDIAGYFTAQPSATAAGRLVTQSPQRILDTRSSAAPGPTGRLDAGGSITLKVLGRSGIPSKGVAAVVLNLTATEVGGAGFVTAFPNGAAQPLASAINVNRSGDTVANQVIVPVGANGSITLASSVAAHLVADAVGYVTDATAPTATTGLFVPLTPERVFDTRPGEPVPGPKGLVPARTKIRPTVGGVAGIPDNAGAVALNVTVIGTAPGYATLWPAGETRPLASNVNVVGAGDIRANGAIVRLGAGSDLDVWVLTDAHVLADVFGYFLH